MVCSWLGSQDVLPQVNPWLLLWCMASSCNKCHCTPHTCTHVSSSRCCNTANLHPSLLTHSTIGRDKITGWFSTLLLLIYRLPLQWAAKWGVCVCDVTDTLHSLPKAASGHEWLLLKAVVQEVTLLRLISERLFKWQWDEWRESRHSQSCHHMWREVLICINGKYWRQTHLRVATVHISYLLGCRKIL